MGNLFGCKQCHPIRPSNNINQSQPGTWPLQRNNWTTVDTELEDGRVQLQTCGQNNSVKTKHLDGDVNDDTLKDIDGWKNKSQAIKSLQKENISLILANGMKERETKDLMSVIEQKKEEITRLQLESEDLKSRLSKLASDRLMDNNPNITDLSDENRAVKVGEQFSELYSNEWSDAYEELISHENMSEEEAIQCLVDTIINIFDTCKETAQEQFCTLEQAILAFTGDKKLNQVLTMSLKVYKDERKRQYKSTIPSTKAISGVISNIRTSSFNRYIETATKICWLMCIQDPPMVLLTIKKGKKFDRKNFNAYTSFGKRVAYLVWPALLLFHEGPVVQKGVAQGRNKKKRSHWSKDTSRSIIDNVYEKTDAVDTSKTLPIADVHG